MLKTEVRVINRNRNKNSTFWRKAISFSNGVLKNRYQYTALKNILEILEGSRQFYNLKIKVACIYKKCVLSVLLRIPFATSMKFEQNFIGRYESIRVRL